MEKTYERINWENYPSVVTPLNEKNLNKVDSALYEVDNRVLGLDTAKLDKSTANTMVKDVSFDEATGIFTITLLDGTTKTIDTKLEKIAINFRYDKESQKLILTLVDGSEQEVDLSSLISQYEFSDGNIISFSVDSDGKVSAIVKGGSITEDKLQPNFLADVKVEASKAKSSSDSAYDNATIASNSAQEAKTYRDEAKQYRDEVVAVTDVEIATKDKAGLVKGGKTAVSEDGELLFTKTTTDRTLTESHAGGLIINSIDGESQQKQYSGKNLYNEKLLNKGYSYSGVTITKDAETGNLTISGTATANTNMIMDAFTLPAGTYYYQKGTTSNVSVILYNQTAKASASYGGSFILSEESTLDIRVQCVNGGSPKGTIKIQIEAGSTMTDYEPYVGGTASPNPDYKQDIKNVEVSEIKGVGKNLFNINGEVNTNFNGDIVVKNTVKDGVLTSNNNRNTSSGSGQMITTEIGKTYIASATIVSLGGGTSASLMITKKGQNNTIWVNGSVVGDRISVRYTAESTDTLLEITTRGGTGAQFKDIQFEEVADGVTTPTDYEPYTEKSIQLSAPITLRSIGDVKDVLCKRDGVYEVAREYKPFVIDGAGDGRFNRTAQQTDTTTYRFSYADDSIINEILKVSNNAVVDMLCNTFVPIKFDDIYDKSSEGISLYVAGSIIWYADKFKNYTVEEMKAWLAENPIRGIYRLETPTFEPLPLADQIALRQLETFDAVTYISTDSEIEPIMEVEYGTSKVGAYAIKGMNDIEVEKFRLNETEETIENMQHSTEIIRATLNSGVTEITISDNRITENSVLSFYTSIYGVSPKTATVANGSVTLTFDAQEENIEVGVRVDG